MYAKVTIAHAGIFTSELNSNGVDDVLRGIPSAWRLCLDMETMTQCGVFRSLQVLDIQVLCCSSPTIRRTCLSTLSQIKKQDG